MTQEVSAVLSKVAAAYPAALRAGQEQDIDRIAYTVELVREHVPAGGTVADLGGGIGLLSPALGALGYRTILVDDFRDTVNQEHPIHELAVHKTYGVEIVSADIATDPPSFEPGSLDGALLIETVEHWHCSPKATLHKVMAALKPGGFFCLSVPNCADLPKRVLTLAGRAKWSPMQSWYEEPVFRGHVREHDVDDLRYIARDLGLTDVRIAGRNWMFRHVRGPLRPAFGWLDQGLRSFPSLCTDLYLIGRKPAA